LFSKVFFLTQLIVWETNKKHQKQAIAETLHTARKIIWLTHTSDFKM